MNKPPKKKPAGRSCPAGIAPLIKRVVALPGDRVELDRDHLFVNGEPIPGVHVRPLDSHGRPLPHAPWGVHRVGPRDVWILGDAHPRSLDSRYFGPVPLKLTRPTRPLFTLPPT